MVFESLSEEFRDVSACQYTGDCLTSISSKLWIARASERVQASRQVMHECHRTAIQRCYSSRLRIPYYEIFTSPWTTQNIEPRRRMMEIRMKGSKAGGEVELEHGVGAWLVSARAKSILECEREHGHEYLDTSGQICWMRIGYACLDWCQHGTLMLERRVRFRHQHQPTSHTTISFRKVPELALLIHVSAIGWGDKFPRDVSNRRSI